MNLIKSKKRVADHGEVFTPQWLVKNMLDLVKGETERIDSRFLEPAFGSGNFLVPALQRKLAAVEAKFGKNDFERRHYALLAVMCTYGIEILTDNIAECRANMLKGLADYLLISQIPEVEKHTARFGRESSRQRFSSVKGHVVTDNPLERAEMDHTVLDMFVIDDRTFLPLGRPYITACIDDFTRCILGIHVGFTPPSFNTVAKCLKHCFLPKGQLREEYPDVQEDWLAYGVMKNLVIDNGLEFHSQALEQVCLSLGITVTYAARKEPWFKGKIERFFGTLNRVLAHGNPGTTFSNIFAKGDYDPTKHAVITMSNLKTIVMKWVADVYHQQEHRSIQMSPAKMWASNVRLEDIRLPDETTQLDATMGRCHERTLTHQGIEFEGMRYNSPDLARWRQSRGPKLKAQIRVDEDDLGSIYVLSPDSAAAYVVPCLNQEYAAGTSLWQHKIYKNWQAQNKPSDNGAAGWVEAKMEIQRLIEEDMSSGRRRSHKRVGRYLQDSARASRAVGTDRSHPAQSPLQRVADETALEQAHYAALAKSPEEVSHLGTAKSEAPRRMKPIYKSGYTGE